MNTCYILTFGTFFLLFLAFVQSFSNFPVFQANHVSFMILVSIVYFFTETLVIFFFVGTGVSVKEYVLSKKLPEQYRLRSLKVKRKVYPPLLLNMLFMIILFVTVGAVDTHRFPAWTYQLFFVLCLAHYAYIKIGQNTCFKDMTQIILDMSGVERPV